MLTAHKTNHNKAEANYVEIDGESTKGQGNEMDIETEEDIDNDEIAWG